MRTPIIAAVLLAAATVPTGHWYTEDTKSRTCTTLERAYDFIGGPRTPEELRAALEKLGEPYDVIQNDEYGVTLRGRLSKFPVLAFRIEATCNTLLREILAGLGPSAPAAQPPATEASDWWRAEFNGTCTKIERFGFGNPGEIARDKSFETIGPILDDVAVFRSGKYGIMIFRRGLSACEIAAKALAFPPNRRPPSGNRR